MQLWLTKPFFYKKFRKILRKRLRWRTLQVFPLDSKDYFHNNHSIKHLLKAASEGFREIAVHVNCIFF